MKKGFLWIMVVMVITVVIAGLWDSIPVISNTVHTILDPSLGYLLNLNLQWGFVFIVLIIVFLTTLIQKYGTDQDALKELKEEQKRLQEEMKQNKENTSKMMELQKKQLEHLPKTFELTMKPVIYTAVPFILLIRWFTDIFKNLGDPKILGFLSWIWAYILLSLLFSIILRKILKVH